MKSFAIVIMLIILVACDGAKPNHETTEEHFTKESDALPVGSRIIQTYKNDWMKWEFEGQCFLSRHIGWHNHIEKEQSVMASVPCPQQ